MVLGGSFVTDSDPQHSLMFENRLIAYIWPLDGPLEEYMGSLSRAGHSGLRICDVPFAEIVCFMQDHEPALQYWVEQTDSLDAFLYRLKVEGYQGKPGRELPHGHQQRF